VLKLSAFRFNRCTTALLPSSSPSSINNALLIKSQCHHTVHAVETEIFQTPLSLVLIFVYINCILTKLCQWKVGDTVIMNYEIMMNLCLCLHHILLCETRLIQWNTLPGWCWTYIGVIFVCMLMTCGAATLACPDGTLPDIQYNSAGYDTFSKHLIYWYRYIAIKVN